MFKKVKHITLQKEQLSFIQFKPKHLDKFVKQFPNIITWAKHSNDYIYDVMIEYIPKIVKENLHKQMQTPVFYIEFKTYWRKFDVTVTRLKNKIYVEVCKSTTTTVPDGFKLIDQIDNVEIHYYEPKWQELLFNSIVDLINKSNLLQ